MRLSTLLFTALGVCALAMPVRGMDAPHYTIPYLRPEALTPFKEVENEVSVRAIDADETIRYPDRDEDIRYPDAGIYAEQG